LEWREFVSARPIVVDAPKKKFDPPSPAHQTVRNANDSSGSRVCTRRNAFPAIQTAMSVATTALIVMTRFVANADFGDALLDVLVASK
jgi:hypothetical protein